MLHITDDQFEQIISEAIDSLPEKRISELQNVAITYDDKPTQEQRTKLKLRGSQTLFGLYEGIPLTKRAAASGLFSGTPVTLPDKITVFKLPLLSVSSSLEEFKEQVKHTLWHEVAHYYGLEHDQIHKLEK